VRGYSQYSPLLAFIAAITNTTTYIINKTIRSGIPIIIIVNAKEYIA
jgi:hypothetical protein